MPYRPESQWNSRTHLCPSSHSHYSSIYLKEKIFHEIGIFSHIRLGCLGGGSVGDGSNSGSSGGSSNNSSDSSTRLLKLERVMNFQSKPVPGLPLALSKNS